MPDLIVTTPKSQIENAAKEAQCAKDLFKKDPDANVVYFRRLSTAPKNFETGGRLYYVEDGFIRGFAYVHGQGYENIRQCKVTGKFYQSGYCLEMSPKSWHWIEPIPMKGFQGWRYAPENLKVKIVGTWLDPKPEIPAIPGFS